ncbi:MAG TPA: DUF4260 domain-containing protein [bacterium]|nr:DUF4260 domain-containing protein [bacterium]
MFPRVLTPGTLLRLEGGTGFVLALLFYQRQHGSWLLFILLILAPDLSMLGYLGGKRIGAACYNAVHSYVPPVGLVAYGVLARSPLAVTGSLIWFAHIAGDRLLGYGLKYPSDFKDTHLRRL